jgi:hypothetical protein
MAANEETADNLLNCGETSPIPLHLSSYQKPIVSSQTLLNSLSSEQKVFPGWLKTDRYRLQTRAVCIVPI